MKPNLDSRTCALQGGQGPLGRLGRVLAWAGVVGRCLEEGRSLQVQEAKN